MKVNHKITRAERDVMEVLWEQTEPLQTKDLSDAMASKGIRWKRQTLNTILFRLEEKGVVKRGHAYVEALLTEEELLQAQTQEILDNLYDGEYGNFFAALTGNKVLDGESKALLDTLISKLRRK